ncbi:MAG: CARDB domain-containing protein [Nocardioides sp.]
MTASPTPAPAQRNVSVRILSVKQQGGRLVAKLLLTNSGNRDLNGVELLVRDNGTVVGHATPARLAAGDFAVRSVHWRYAAGVKHRIVALADPRDLVAESDETDNRDRAVFRVR